MKIVFFGTGEFSAAILQGLLSYTDVEVALVVSQPDKPVGRKMEVLPTPVKQVALESGLCVMQPEKLKNNEDFIRTLTLVQADFFVVVAYGKILPQSILDIPKYFPLNIHGSILPKYRGASPIQESLKNGDEWTGLTIMQMTFGMDEGPTFKIEKIKVDIVDKTPTVFEKFATVGPKLVYEVMSEIVQKGLAPHPQPQEGVSYCSKIEKEHGKVLFSQQTAKQIYDLFRAYTPWPGIYTLYEGKKFAIEDCFFTEDLTGPAGKFFMGDDKKVYIGCKVGALEIKEVKLEGKKKVDIRSFFNGNKEAFTFVFE